MNALHRRRGMVTNRFLHNATASGVSSFFGGDIRVAPQLRRIFYEHETAFWHDNNGGSGDESVCADGVGAARAR